MIRSGRDGIRITEIISCDVTQVRQTHRDKGGVIEGLDRAFEMILGDRMRELECVTHTSLTLSTL